MEAYSYDRSSATIKRLDLAWLEGLRRDFLMMLKNLPKVHDYKTAHQLKRAFRVYRENFDDLFFDHFLKTDLKYKSGLQPDDAAYLDRKIRSIAWGFSIELSGMPIGYVDDYYRSEEGRFDTFKREFPTWKTRMQRRAAAFWKEMKEVIDYYTKALGASPDSPRPDIEVRMPAVENATVEGFKLVMKGFENDDEHHPKELAILQEGLRIYRKRAAAVAPILLKQQLPVIVEFRSTIDKGGEYHRDGTISIFASSFDKGPPWVAHVMAHEMGHHLFQTYLSKSATDFWYATIRGDYGPIDLKELLDKWPGDAWAYDFPRALGDKDPILALQVQAYSQAEHGRGPQRKDEYQKLYDEGEKTLVVPKTPITGYANKNPEEAFCEALGMLVAYGPAVLHERVRFWLDTAMAGAVKVSSTDDPLLARVLSRFRAR